MFIFWGYTAGGSLYHVADCSTECVFVAEAFYSRKICAKALLSVSAQIQEDLDRVGLQSRYEISVRNYKVALCFFPALVLQPTSQNTLVGTKGAWRRTSDNVFVTSMAMIG